MDERTKQAFENVRDTAKQLITLATGVLALTITFSKDFFHDNPRGAGLVQGAWYALLVSTLIGVWVLMAVTGTVGSAKVKTLSHTHAYGSNIAIPAAMQIVMFVLGLYLVVRYGIGP